MPIAIGSSTVLDNGFVISFIWVFESESLGFLDGCAVRYGGRAIYIRKTEDGRIGGMGAQYEGGCWCTIISSTY